jgi:hypothetical protein
LFVRWISLTEIQFCTIENFIDEKQRPAKITPVGAVDDPFGYIEIIPEKFWNRPAIIPRSRISGRAAALR